MSQRKKVLISGMNGQLVSDIRLALSTKDYEVMALGSREWDIRIHTRSEQFFKQFKPDIYINGASVHVVDEIESDPSKAFEINVIAPYEIVELCNAYDTKFINFSTNYVFGGDDNDNVPFAFDDSTSPTNLYGISKVAFEQVLENYSGKWINYRVAGLFGRVGSRAKKGVNFPFIVLDHLLENKPMKVVEDQRTSIGYTKDLAEHIVNNFDNSGHCHLSNEGYVSWYEVAEYIASLFGKQDLISPTTAEEFYSLAPRGMNTMIRTNQDKRMPDWQDGINRFIINEVARMEKYEGLFK